MDERAASPAPTGRTRLVSIGIAAWSIVGIAVLSVMAFLLAAEISLVLAPLTIALFPAALLDPLAVRMRRRLPRALTATILVLALLLLVALVVTVIGWLLVDELDELGDALGESYEELRELVRDSPLGVDPGPADELGEQLREWAGRGGLADAQQFAVTVIEGFTAVLLTVLALWFYLKDGDRIAGWVRERVPRSWRTDATEMCRRAWAALGGYFRGQIVVAAVDAVGIGIGLLVLGVPLAGPLAVLVFFGGFFPIVGATVTGMLAVLVALASDGLGMAIAVLVLVIAVQQLEGNLLEPLIVGRATRLHPFVVLVVLTAGAVTFGILGAFLAVPVTASVVRAVGYLRERDASPAPPTESSTTESMPTEPSASGD